MGGYGFLRISLPFFPEANAYFTPLVFLLSVIAIVYTSLTTLQQTDLKRVIAYSSVNHMGFVTLGLFTFNQQGVEGAVMIMVSHGIVSGALFLCIGILYERYNTRLIKYYSGLLTTMPLFSTWQGFVWIRFPLYALAVQVWLGVDRDIRVVTLFLMFLGTILMCFIFA